jgi:hypothetical protein
VIDYSKHTDPEPSPNAGAEDDYEDDSDWLRWDDLAIAAVALASLVLLCLGLI